MKILNGIDLVNSNRSEFKSDQFAKRIMSDCEYNYYLQLEKKENKQKYCASVFACKEAIMKAYDLAFGFQQIYIQKTNKQRLVFINGILQSHLKLSISYCEQFIVANVVGLLSK